MGGVRSGEGYTVKIKRVYARYEKQDHKVRRGRRRSTTDTEKEGLHMGASRKKGNENQHISTNSHNSSAPSLAPSTTTASHKISSLFQVKAPV